MMIGKISALTSHDKKFQDPFFSVWDEFFIDSLTKYVKNVKDLGVCNKNHENSKFEKKCIKIAGRGIGSARFQGGQPQHS